MKFSSLSYIEKEEHNSDSITTEVMDMFKLKFSPFVFFQLTYHLSQKDNNEVFTMHFN